MSPYERSGVSRYNGVQRVQYRAPCRVAVRYLILHASLLSLSREGCVRPRRLDNDNPRQKPYDLRHSSRVGPGFPGPRPRASRSGFSLGRLAEPAATGATERRRVGKPHQVRDIRDTGARFDKPGLRAPHPMHPKDAAERGPLAGQPALERARRWTRFARYGLDPHAALAQAVRKDEGHAIAPAQAGPARKVGHMPLDDPHQRRILVATVRIHTVERDQDAVHRLENRSGARKIRYNRASSAGVWRLQPNSEPDEQPTESSRPAHPGPRQRLARGGLRPRSCAEGEDTERGSRRHAAKGQLVVRRCTGGRRSAVPDVPAAEQPETFVVIVPGNSIAARPPRERSGLHRRTRLWIEAGSPGDAIPGTARRAWGRCGFLVGVTDRRVEEIRGRFGASTVHPGQDWRRGTHAPRRINIMNALCLPRERRQWTVPFAAGQASEGSHRPRTAPLPRDGVVRPRLRTIPDRVP